MRRLIWTLAILPWPLGSSWETSGHARINGIATALLSQAQRMAIHEMLEGDLEDLAEWERRMTDKYPQTSLFHFHWQSPEQTCQQRVEVQCSEVRALQNEQHLDSLPCASIYFLERVFGDRPSQTPMSMIKNPAHRPKQLPSLSRGLMVSSDLAPSADLRWLVTLLGDLHQPLNWLSDPRGMSPQANVSWNGLMYTLSDFWEQLLPRDAPSASEVIQMGRQFQERAMNWGYLSLPDLFAQWANDIAKVACQEIYDKLQELRPDGILNISAEMHKHWQELAKKHATLGGQRIAYVLQDLLEPRMDPTPQKGLKRPHRPRIPWRSLATNISIALFVVPLQLTLFRWHAAKGDHSRLNIFSKAS